MKKLFLLFSLFTTGFITNQLVATHWGALPTASYQASCKNCKLNYDTDVLTCNCPDRSGKLMSTSIGNASFCVKDGAINNCNGKLHCGFCS